MSRFRIAIDAREAAGQPAGKGRYVAGLLLGLKALAAADVDYILYTRQSLPKDLIPATATVVVLPRWRIPGLRPFWTAWDMRRRQVDCFLSPTGFLPAVLSLVPTAIIIHDLAVWKAPNHPRSVILQEKLLLPWALRRSRGIFVVSRHTGRDLQAVFGVDPARLTVAPAAVGPSFRPLSSRQPAAAAELARVRAAYRLPDKYVLFVGTLEPRKNLLRLIEAYHRLPALIKAATPLLVTGKKGWGYAEIFARVTELGETEQIRFLGYVPDDDLPALYNQATVLAYPSLYEGFGIPPLEAMACGTPVLTSAVSSLPEVVGRAGVLVDPYQPEAITAGLARLLADGRFRDRLAQAGRRRSRQFSWLETAKIILAGLRAMTATRR